MVVNSRLTVLAPVSLGPAVRHRTALRIDLDEDLERELHLAQRPGQRAAGARLDRERVLRAVELLADRGQEVLDWYAADGGPLSVHGTSSTASVTSSVPIGGSKPVTMRPRGHDASSAPVLASRG